MNTSYRLDDFGAMSEPVFVYFNSLARPKKKGYMQLPTDDHLDL